MHANAELGINVCRSILQFTRYVKASTATLYGYKIRSRTESFVLRQARSKIVLRSKENGVIRKHQQKSFFYAFRTFAKGVLCEWSK